MRLSTLESLGLLNSWALGLELLSNSDQKINEKKARCVFTQIETSYNFQDSLSPSPCVTGRGVWGRAALQITVHSTHTLSTVTHLTHGPGSHLSTERETGNFSSPYSWSSGQWSRCTLTKTTKIGTFLVASIFVFVTHFGMQMTQKIIQSRLVDIIKQILKTDFLWWNRLEEYLNRLVDRDNISRIHNKPSLIRTDLRTEFSESVYCYLWNCRSSWWLQDQMTPSSCRIHKYSKILE